MNQALLTFNAGEVSPYLRHRIDFDKTGASAEVMENFIAMPYGGVIKRPGLVHVASVETAGENSRLFPFLASDGSRYLLHFTADTLTVYDPAGAVKETLPFLADYAWPEPFDWSLSLRDVQMVQLNDIAYIVHPACAPMQLSRFSDTSWTLEWLPFTAAPMLDDNLDTAATFAIAGNPVAYTWSVGGHYEPGDKVFTVSEWVCTVAHDAADDKKPGIGSASAAYWTQRLFLKGDAVTLISADRSDVAWTLQYHAYLEGDIRLSLTEGVGLCLRDHSGGTFSPEDANPLANWARLQDWVFVDEVVSAGTFRSVDYEIYECILTHNPHTEGTGSEPGLDGGVWWQPTGQTITFPIPLWILSDDYAVHAEISNGGLRYRCTVPHTPVADNEPGVGAAWADVWQRLYAFGTASPLTTRAPGKYYRISPNRSASDTGIVGAPPNQGLASAAIPVSGAWDLFTYGTWAGTFQVERSVDAGVTWEIIRAYEGAKDRNVADKGEEDSPAMLRIRYWTGPLTDTGDTGRATLIPRLPYVTGHALFTTQVSGNTKLTGTAISPILSGSTWRWAEGAFTTDLGFPRAIAMHDARLILAGTPANPVSIWCSRDDDFTNFETGTEATAGIFRTLALTNASPIRWLASQRRLIAGTSQGEWVVGSESNEAAMSPSNFMARQHSAYGSATVAPLIANDALFFVERKGTRLREYGFSAERGSYDAADLSRLAEHLTSPGLSNFAWQQTREPGLWVVRRDGVLCHLAYARAERLAAWSRHLTTGGLFRDVAVLPSDAGDDEVFFIIDRDAGSALERFPQHWQAAQETGTGWFHLDGATGTGPVEALPDHLQAATVLLVNGILATTDLETTLAALEVTDKWQAGVPIVSRLVGLPIDTSAQDGTTQARRKRTHKILLSLYQSAGGHLYNVAETRRQPIPNTRPATTLRTGWEETIPDAGALDDLQLRLYHADPFPFCLRAAVMRWMLNEA